jgi:hypothetical protein
MRFALLDGERVAESTEALAEMIFGEFLPNCDLSVTQQSKMVELKRSKKRLPAREF